MRSDINQQKFNPACFAVPSHVAKPFFKKKSNIKYHKLRTTRSLLSRLAKRCFTKTLRTHTLIYAHTRSIWSVKIAIAFYSFYSYTRQDIFDAIPWNQNQAYKLTLKIVNVRAHTWCVVRGGHITYTPNTHLFIKWKVYRAKIFIKMRKLERIKTQMQSQYDS